MPKTRISSARREIIAAFTVIRQIPGEGTIVQRIVKMTGRPLDKNRDNSFVRKVIREYTKQ